MMTKTSRLLDRRVSQLKAGTREPIEAPGVLLVLAHLWYLDMPFRIRATGCRTVDW